MTAFANHILLADNDAHVRSAIAETLLSAGFQVVEAATCKEALQVFRDDPCVVVISKATLTDTDDGIALLEQVRDIDERVQVIVTAPLASADGAIRALRLGASDFVAAPLDNLMHLVEATRLACDTLARVEKRDLQIAALTRNNRELTRLNQKFRDLAIRDGLTGVHNHRHFQDALKREVKRARRYHRELSVMFIDVDNFKNYNDTHGHQLGDELLVTLAGLLESHVRAADMVARWGGEEFVVMAPETGRDDCLSLAENLRLRVLEHEFPGEEQQPGGQLTVSIGVANWRVGGDDHELVQRADEALYEAKDSGRNRVCVAR